MRRRHNRYMFRNRYGTSFGNDFQDVPYEEFKFYNSTSKLVEEEELSTIYNQVTKEHRQILWTNKILGNSGILFRFKLKKTPTATERFGRLSPNEREQDDPADVESNPQNSIYVDIIEVNCIIDPELLKTAKGMIRKSYFSTFDIDADTQALFALFDWDSNVDDGQMKVFKSIQEFSNYMIENGHIKHFKQSEVWDDFSDDVKTLFEIDLTKKPEVDFIDSSGYSSRNTDVKLIFDVVEKRINNRNYRLAFICEPSRYSSEHYTIDVFDEDSEVYNYIDKGRIFFKANFYGETKKVFMDLSTNRYNEKGEYEIVIDVFNHIYNDISQILQPNDRLITPTLYRFYHERYGERSVTFQKNEQFEKLKERYQSILIDGRDIKINDVVINTTSITLGDEFKMEFTPDFLDVISKLSDVRYAVNIESAEYNFNVMYERLLGVSAVRVIDMNKTKDNSYKEFTEAKFKVNGINIIVHKRNNRMAINGIFTRIDDVYPILCRAVCYGDEATYNKFIRDVSYIGVEWKKLINNGIQLELVNPFYRIFQKTGISSYEKIIMRFSLLWDTRNRSQVYLLANNTKYLIRYKGKFKRYLGLPSVVQTMENLKIILTECLGSFDTDRFVELVKNAISEGEIVKKRGEELVRLTISETNAEESTIELNGGKQLSGYKLVGLKTKTPYFINKITLEVYKMKDGAWNRRCVVDDPNKQRIFEDRLANRLVNIYNEFRGISTIQD